MTNTDHDTITPEETAQTSAEINQADQALISQLLAAKEQVIRTTADFDNFRRRTERERVEWITVARVTVLKKFLPLTDDLDRAFASMPTMGEAENPAINVMVDGFKLMQKNLHKALQEMGVEEIPAEGAFNPELHEALMQVEAADKPTGMIIHVFEKGYKLGDHIIRHSKVSVAK